MKITLIDDDKIVLFVHTKLLKNFYPDSQINSYLCPEDFVSDLEKSKAIIPDAILSDYNMGVVNGLELLDRVEKIKKSSSIYNDKLNFYLVSSELKLDSICENCTSEIFKGYFSKPLSKDSIACLFNNFSIAS